MAVPEATLSSLRETLDCVDDLQDNLHKFLSLAEPDVLAVLPPIQRARAFFLLAKSATALLSVKLRCSGICPDDHPIKTELERLDVCEGKLERHIDWSKAPLKRSTTVNRQAATRFIEHSLPDLTPEQRQKMREVSRGGGMRSTFSENRRAQKKRKYQESEKTSARTAAQEFLKKAACELLGPSNSVVKGPLRNVSSDEEDEPMA